jgi:hypothetical protein
MCTVGPIVALCHHCRRASLPANAPDGDTMKRLFAAAALLATFNYVAAGEMSLYSRPDFRGSEITVHGSASNFVDLGFNDRVSSIVVHSGAWEVCEHKDFGGRCTVLERGQYPTLNRLNDSISSVREVDRGRDRDGYRDRGDRSDRNDRNDRNDRGEWRDRRDDERGAPIELFGARNFGGDRVELAGDIRTLRSRNFNDRAGSLVVREGRWEVCEHDDYRGRCVAYGPGRYPQLEGLNNLASSVRRIR